MKINDDHIRLELMSQGSAVPRAVFFATFAITVPTGKPWHLEKGRTYQESKTRQNERNPATRLKLSPEQTILTQDSEGAWELETPAFCL